MGHRRIVLAGPRAEGPVYDMSAPGDRETELAVAIRAARRAATASLEHRARPAVSTKADGSPVTSPDLAADAAIRTTLREAFPGDAILTFPPSPTVDVMIGLSAGRPLDAWEWDIAPTDLIVRADPRWDRAPESLHFRSGQVERLADRARSCYAWRPEPDGAILGAAESPVVGEASRTPGPAKRRGPAGLQRWGGDESRVRRVAGTGGGPREKPTEP